MKRVLPLLFLCLLLPLAAPAPAGACFGPKLYLGAGSGNRADVLYQLVSIYVKEKTGTDTVRVPLTAKEAAKRLAAGKLDLAFFPVKSAPKAQVVLALPGLPPLAAGKRPLQDLQFTTVVPALKKLATLLSPVDVALLTGEVDHGASAAAAVRHFLMTRGWI